jgi:hypothetical protein
VVGRFGNFAASQRNSSSDCVIIRRTYGLCALCHLHDVLLPGLFLLHSFLRFVQLTLFYRAIGCFSALFPAFVLPIAFTFPYSVRTLVLDVRFFCPKSGRLLSFSLAFCPVFFGFPIISVRFTFIRRLSSFLLPVRSSAFNLFYFLTAFTLLACDQKNKIVQ